MDVKTLDATMRIRINGPNNVEQFKASFYAKAWIASGHLRSDDPTQIPKKRKIDTILDDEDLDDLQFLPVSTLF